MARGGDPPKDKRLTKEAALAAALRANLRRRKPATAKAGPAKPPGAPAKKGR
jgi:hypothetical protein